MSWIITIASLYHKKKIYKVTRHFLSLSISETHFFSRKYDVQQQIIAWLD
ncbi:hypothetical protein HZC31_08625 [Candidatus Woesearchaeota archaeon]|nr:hypothetical protein [Candidatus Woesearchaeota archaeon]